MDQRVQKVLAQWGIASRRQAEKMIEEGRVRLNGNLVQLGQKVDLNCDRLEVDGKIIKSGARPQKIYLLLNKPKGVLSTCSDPEHRQTVLDLLPPYLKNGTGIHPIGRLDAKSTGALILTNDGDLTLALTHPRYHLPKVYNVRLKGYLTDAQLHQWSQGVILDEQKTLPAQIELKLRSREETKLEITLTEGKNRQIRRIAEQFGLEVLQLHRKAIGDLTLKTKNGEPLAKGRYRNLTPREVNNLIKQTS